MLPVMILSCGYMILRRVLQLVIVVAGGERANAVAVLVLRHQVASAFHRWRNRLPTAVVVIIGFSQTRMIIDNSRSRHADTLHTATHRVHRRARTLKIKLRQGVIRIRPANDIWADPRVVSVDAGLSVHDTGCAGQQGEWRG